MIDLRLGDCLEIMRDMPAQSFDAIIADIPYGTTACSWDTVIPFAPMWENLKRLAKPRAAIVLFGSQPFTSALIMSNADSFRYNWTWKKTRNSNPYLAKYQPLRITEDILVFGDAVNYFPQMEHGEPYRINRFSGGRVASDSKTRLEHFETSEQIKHRYPKNIIEIANKSVEMGFHPTQKPVALMEYLIKTYTNEGDTVLDFTMGSGTTMVAAVNTKRNGVGIEINPQYFEIAQRRIQEAQAQMTLPIG